MCRACQLSLAVIHATKKAAHIEARLLERPCVQAGVRGRNAQTYVAETHRPTNKWMQMMVWTRTPVEAFLVSKCLANMCERRWKCVQIDCEQKQKKKRKNVETNKSSIVSTALVSPVCRPHPDRVSSQDGRAKPSTPPRPPCAHPLSQRCRALVVVRRSARHSRPRKVRGATRTRGEGGRPCAARVVHVLIGRATSAKPRVQGG